MHLKFLGLYTAASILAAAIAEAKNVSYSVITSIDGGSSAAVVVDDHVYPLSPSTDDARLLHVGEAPAAEHHYYYAKIKQDRTVLERESFTREPVSDDTPNEFYNRTRNTWSIRKLPKVYEDLPVINRITSDLHRPGIIPTIHFQGNQTEIDSMHTNIFDDIKVTTNVTYISPDQVLTCKDVKLKLSGRSTLLMPKLSYNAEFGEGNDLYGYSHLKFRSMAADRSYIRENIVYNMVESAGLPGTHISYIRVYVNGQPAGLFSLIEPFKKSWLRNEFANGDEDYVQGGMFEAASSPFNYVKYGQLPDLSYVGDNETAYANAPYSIEVDPGKGDPTFKPLVNLTRFLNIETPLEGKDVIPSWDRHLDVDSFLRNIALEVLLGFSDGYILMADNYHIYQEHPDSERFIWVPNDVDTTLGITLGKLSDMLSGNYSTFPGFQTRPLTKQIVRIPELKQRFEYYMRDMAQHLLHPNVSFPYIDDIVSMITEDVEWDLTLPRMSKFNFSEFNLTDIGDLFGSSADSSNFSLEDISKGMPPTVDNATTQDMYSPDLVNITFMQAVNGPTGHIAMSGVKEFIVNQTRATLEYFNIPY